MPAPLLTGLPSSASCPRTPRACRSRHAMRRAVPAATDIIRIAAPGPGGAVIGVARWSRNTPAQSAVACAGAALTIKT